TPGTSALALHDALPIFGVLVRLVGLPVEGVRPGVELVGLRVQLRVEEVIGGLPVDLAIHVGLVDDAAGPAADGATPADRPTAGSAARATARAASDAGAGIGADVPGLLLLRLDVHLVVG